MNKQLSCFIACAFGHKDVDTIYSKSILPVLRELKILPIRVDKLNHNKNIDQKIIELIKKTDFCIADLTYARPSVYYEAGYVHGLKKDVIFTVKHDHFVPNPKDKNGNFKVHFDLITKNIIAWKTPNHRFKQRLKSRIKLILKPILEKLAEEKKSANSQKKFSKQSLTNKLKGLDKSCDAILVKHKFKVAHQLNGKTIALKRIKNQLTLFACHSYSALTLSELKKYGENTRYHIALSDMSNSKPGQITIVFNCLNRVSSTTVQKVFPNHNIGEENNTIIAINPGKKIKIIFFNKLKSTLDLEERLSTYLESL